MRAALLLVALAACTPVSGLLLGRVPPMRQDVPPSQRVMVPNRLQDALLATSLALALVASSPLAVAAAVEPPASVHYHISTFLADDDAAVVPDTAPTPVSEAPPVSEALPVKSDIAFNDLKALLNQCIDGSSSVCKVDAIDFDDAMGETGSAVVEGKRLMILGIPYDNPSNDSRWAEPVQRPRTHGA